MGGSGHRTRKKQWTWGNGEIGRAWDRQLTDGDGPYVELMAGVFTDNQPDFSYLAPGETKEFSQFWYPIQDIGVVHQASRVAALSVDVRDGQAVIGIGAAKKLSGVLSIQLDDDEIHTEPVTIGPGAPHIVKVSVPSAFTRDDMTVRLTDRSGEVVAWRRHDVPEGEPRAATEPPMPAEIDSVDELLLTAQHLIQNRHPTRAAEPYLRRVLELDPQDSRSHLGLAELTYGRGEYETALHHLDTAAARITRRNLNPRTGELSYRRGLVLERLGRLSNAERAYAKATWDGTYALAGHLGTARIRLRQGADASALEAAGTAISIDERNTTAWAYRVIALRRLGEESSAAHTLRLARQRDPLDPFLASLADELNTPDPRTQLLVAHEFARIGDTDAAITWASRSATMGATAFGNTAPQAGYLRALVLDRRGDAARAARERGSVPQLDQTLAFPAGLDDFDALMAAVSAAETDGRDDPTALGLLGSWLLGARRTEDARVALERAVAAGATDPVVARNAAVAIVNTSGDLELADSYLQRALELAEPLTRLVYERDQLARLRGLAPETRIENIELSGVEILERDDLTIAYVELLLDTGRHDEAKRILDTTRFQPFEGGEGRVISAYDRASLAAAAALADVDPARAADLLDRAVQTPENLGEGRHPADPIAHLLVASGDAHSDSGDLVNARERWERARLAGGALAVAPRPARLDDFWIGVAHCRLGELDAAETVWAAMEAAADALEAAPVSADYFATSLPKTLLFAVDDALGRERDADDLRSAAARGRRLSMPEQSSEKVPQ